MTMMLTNRWTSILTTATKSGRPTKNSTTKSPLTPTNGPQWMVMQSAKSTKSRLVRPQTRRRSSHLGGATGVGKRVCLPLSR